MKGMSLVELLATIAVVAILMTAGAPTYSTFIKNQEASAMSAQLYSTLMYARSEAIKRNARIVVLPGDAVDYPDDTVHWLYGLYVMDGYSNEIRDNAFSTLSGSVALTMNGLYIIFDGKGQIESPKTFFIKVGTCIARVITVQSSGSIQMTSNSC